MGHWSGYCCPASATTAWATLLRRKAGSAAAPGAAPAWISAERSGTCASGGSPPLPPRASWLSVWAHQKRTSTYALAWKRDRQSCQQSGAARTASRYAAACAFTPASTPPVWSKVIRMAFSKSSMPTRPDGAAPGSAAQRATRAPRAVAAACHKCSVSSPAAGAGLQAQAVLAACKSEQGRSEVGGDQCSRRLSVETASAGVAAHLQCHPAHVISQLEPWTAPRVLQPRRLAAVMVRGKRVCY